MTGVYQIVNKVNGLRYIGQSKDCAKRFSGHLYHLRTGRHACKRLQRSYDKHGREAFVFGVLEICSREELNEVEQKYLDAGFSLGTVYNTARVAEAPARGAKRSARTLRIMSEGRKRLFRDPVFRERMLAHLKAARPKLAAALRGRKKSAEHRASLSKAQQRRFSDPDGYRKLIESLNRRSERWRAGVAERGTRWRQNPEFVARHDAAIAKRSDNPQWQASMAAHNRSPKMRDAVRMFWDRLKADPVAYAAFIAKRSAAQKKGRS